MEYALPDMQTKTAEKKDKDKKKKAPTAEPMSAGLAGTMGALNIFDRNAAVSMVMSSATGRSSVAEFETEQIKGAMQWDLWNPWAIYYELHSTHPLVAHRLQYLGDQAAALGQEPLLTFDRANPQSYWDTFLIDLSVMVLPWFCFV